MLKFASTQSCHNATNWLFDSIVVVFVRRYDNGSDVVVAVVN